MTVFGDPYYIDGNTIGQRAASWSDAARWQLLSTALGKPAAVCADGSRALFKFEGGPNVYYLWTQASGFMETSIPTLYPALMTSDGKWILGTQKTSQNGKLALGVWRGDGTLHGDLKEWLGQDFDTDINWTYFRLTAASGYGPYHLAGYESSGSTAPAVILNHVGPGLDEPAPKRFRLGIQSSLNLREWSHVTNLTVTFPDEITNGFLKITLIPFSEVVPISIQSGGD